MESFIQGLEQLSPLSVVVKTYLKMTLGERQFAQGEKVLLKDSGSYSMPFLSSGSLRIAAKNLDSEKETTLFFFFAGDFIMPLPYLEKVFPLEFYAEFLEPSVVIDFENKQWPELFRLCPEVPEISRKLHSRQYLSMLSHLEKRNNLSGEEHYKQLIREHPVLLKLASLSQLASFLGLEPNSLSHIRSRISKSR